MSNTETAPKTPKFETFDPSQLFAASQQAAHKMLDQYAELEAQWIARAKQAIETWSQLAQEALAYSAQLSVQARKLGLDTARKIGA